MGKKQKKPKSLNEEKELAETVDNLLAITTLPIQNNIVQALECQKKISSLLVRTQFLEDKLLKKQNKFSKNDSKTVHPDKTTIDTFLKWLKEHGAELNGCSVAHFEGYDLGIKAEQDIPQSSLVIVVPRELMISVETAQKGVAEDLIEKVEILKSMPNVLLAIGLLIEKFTDNSFWKPYIDVLPKTYHTVLYFTINELEELKGSPTLEVALKQIKSIARQYAYFHRLFNRSENSVNQLMRGRFTFNEYCWAVSTVMTRQNMIPSSDGSAMINALIPLWDLCNHSNGTISTAYNPELNRSECLAFKDFKANEQLFIFYGARTNADFFIHNGFVYEENENDTYWIRLGISKSDPLEEQRRKLLEKLKIFHLSEFPIKAQSFPVNECLLGFLRIFQMDSDQLNHWINSDRTADLLHWECALDTSLEIKVWTFLKTRLSLLLASYKTKLEEDEKLLLHGQNLSENTKLAIRMRITEKRLLRGCLEYVEQMVKK
ncbi:hypothetical protein ABEB36_004712 [Hypothenemus hampei]|uniref:protein-histidine N-methyltransferase n=1 Tax=Hypothenemus hampei TaxID=57062 RepID=A0ABD1F6U4_HYPHA